MKFSDFLIIYLACGAPFGVFFFLQNRGSKNSPALYLRSFCIVFVWIPYAVSLLHDFITKRFPDDSGKISQRRKLENLQKQITQILFESNSNLSVFELREIFERYIGLTLAQNSDNGFPSKTDEEIFRVALRQNIKLGATCLRRKNKARIAVHQNSARQDFLNFIKELNNSAADQQLQQLTLEFVQVLNDSQTVEDLAKIFASKLQNLSAAIVQSTEDLWTPDNKQLSTRNKIPLRLRALTAMRKD